MAMLTTNTYIHTPGRKYTNTNRIVTFRLQLFRSGDRLTLSESQIYNDPSLKLPSYLENNNNNDTHTHVNVQTRTKQNKERSFTNLLCLRQVLSSLHRILNTAEPFSQIPMMSTHPKPQQNKNHAWDTPLGFQLYCT